MTEHRISGPLQPLYRVNTETEVFTVGADRVIVNQWVHTEILHSEAIARQRRETWQSSDAGKRRDCLNSGILADR